jgi:hypothetical protein
MDLLFMEKLVVGSIRYLYTDKWYILTLIAHRGVRHCNYWLDLSLSTKIDFESDISLSSKLTSC